MSNSSTKSEYRGQILRPDGYSLVELLLVIMVVGVLASVAVKSLRGVNEVARAEETKLELDQIAYAIAGNPDLVSGGVRTDYGYVGDVGALPSNLDALVTNPGAYATWKGPYIHDKLSAGGANVYFKSDAWGKTYTFSGGTTIASSGGTSTMTRNIANSTAELLTNKVAVTITDIDGTPPGTVYKDSLRFVLTYPDGSGGTTTTALIPASDGFIEVSSIPIGIHSAQVLYLPTNDTLRRKVNVDPGRDYYADIHLFADVWSPSGGGGGGGGGSGAIEYVSGTIGFNKGDKCEEVVFDITNTSGSNITLTNMTVSWSTPNTWYDQIKFDGNKIFDQNSPSNATGDVATFNSSQVVTPGQTINVLIKNFQDQNDGDGNDVDMSNVTFTITFSDGSTFNVTTPTCP